MLKTIYFIFFLTLGYCSLKANEFAKGTLITMNDFSVKKIENLQAGDSILVINLDEKNIESIIVESIVKVKVEKSVQLELADGSQLKMSENNLLLSNTGWLAFNENIIEDNPVIKIKIASINDFVVCLNSNHAIQSFLIDKFSYEDQSGDYYRIFFKNTDKEYAFIVNNMFASCFFDFFK